MKNYETLIIAGIGAVGSSLLKLGERELQSFRQIVLIDQDADALANFQGKKYSCRHGSVDDYRFLEGIVPDSGASALFVNLCSNTNNVRLRKFFGPLNVGYLDSCASMTHNRSEYRFSRMMDYTLTTVQGPSPHWLCWGVNPGLVEIITRRILRDMAFSDRDVAVTVFEYDQLTTKNEGPGVAAVGWCPQALIEEVMLSPALVIRGGVPVESQTAGARKAISFWQGVSVPSWVVAHEDIWNMAMIEGVRDANFLYGLAPRVMNILEGQTQVAREKLRVPEADSPVFGLERLAVQVKALEDGTEATMFWRTDHYDVWRKYGVNAVQYQTAKSLLFAMRLLQNTHYGKLPGTYCASDLPISQRDWALFEDVFEELGIHWQDGRHLELSFAEEAEAVLTL